MYVPDKIFVDHAPCKSARREIAPFISDAETGRSVSTHGRREKVFFKQAIIHSSEIGGERIFLLAGSRHQRGSADAQVICTQVVGEEPVGRAAERSLLEYLEGNAAYRVNDIVLVDLPVIG